MGGWRLFLDGTNHPSITLRVVSCSKVRAEESVFNNYGSRTI